MVNTYFVGKRIIMIFWLFVAFFNYSLFFPTDLFLKLCMVHLLTWVWSMILRRNPIPSIGTHYFCYTIQIYLNLFHILSSLKAESKISSSGQFIIVIDNWLTADNCQRKRVSFSFYVMCICVILNVYLVCFILFYRV